MNRASHTSNHSCRAYSHCSMVQVYMFQHLCSQLVLSEAIKKVVSSSYQIYDIKRLYFNFLLQEVKLTCLYDVYCCRTKYCFLMEGVSHSNS
nr:MAG TPA: hypothetical protein [Caudoviricetes sp.]